MLLNTFLFLSSASSEKASPYKPYFEFKHAVARYVKRMEGNCPYDGRKNSTENSAHKKELRYLSAHYGKFSTITLLARIRSAHQAMIKQDSSGDSDVYQRYEGISSALLLICSQVFFNDIRNQILNALYEIDNRIAYWRYQQNHQVRYFFTKLPIKWVVGENQQKEIVDNIIMLERKQRALYTLLGSLTAHAYLFVGIENSYESCYAWIETLLQIVSCIKTPLEYHSDETRFDIIAAELELKFKKMNKSRSYCMLSPQLAKKPHHLVRNWIVYTMALAASGYIVHYSCKNPDTVKAAVNAVHDELGKFFVLLLHPLNKIYERGKLIFSEDTKKVANAPREVTNVSREPNPTEKVNNDSKRVNNSEQKNDAEVNPQDLSLQELLSKITELGEGMQSEITLELQKSNTSLRQEGFEFLKSALEDMKNPKDGFVYHSTYTYDEVAFVDAVNKAQIVVEPIIKNNILLNPLEYTPYKNAVDYLYKFAETASEQVPRHTSFGRSLYAKLLKGLFLLRLDNDYLTPLTKFPGIMEGKLLPLFKFSAALVGKLGKQIDGLIEQANQLEVQAHDQLRDHELTFMFTALIPLGLTSLGLSRLYQWVTMRNYAPIRLALAEVNSLLIESTDHANHHDYGKLVYLVSKLRYTTIALHDSLSDEFLSDVAKLESKQYSATTKCSIIQNMFNKYAFLGRVAV